MTERKWTPGNWYAAGGYVTSDALHQSTEIAYIEDDGNRHLFAAAPDLYNALDTIVQNCIPDDESRKWFKDARAALAKARGE